MKKKLSILLVAVMAFAVIFAGCGTNQAPVEEGLSDQEAADQVRQSSRRYAKRQLTWFRRNKSIRWLTRKPGQDGSEILTAARQLLQENDR